MGKQSWKSTITAENEFIQFFWSDDTTCEGAATSQYDAGPTNKCFTNANSELSIMVLSQK